MIPPGAGVIALVGGLEQTHHPIRRRWNRAALLGRRSARTNYRWPDDVAERPRYPGAPGTPVRVVRFSQNDLRRTTISARRRRQHRKRRGARRPCKRHHDDSLRPPRRGDKTPDGRVSSLCPSRREGRAARVLPPGFVLPRRISVKPFRSCQSLLHAQPVQIGRSGRSPVPLLWLRSRTLDRLLRFVHELRQPLAQRFSEERGHAQRRPDLFAERLT
jgi:hypothetical protein